MKSFPFITLILGTLILLGACDQPIKIKNLNKIDKNGSADPAVVINPLKAITETLILFPQSYVGMDGKLGDGQTMDSLALADQKDEDRDWIKYVEFSPAKNFEGAFEFQVLENFAKVIDAKISFNFLGYRADLQAWNFQMKDITTGEWITVADNSEVAPWKWSKVEVSITNPGRFIKDTGTVELKFVSNFEVDGAFKTPVYIDFLSLEMTVAK